MFNKKENTSELSSQNSELIKQNKDLQEEVGRLTKKLEDNHKGWVVSYKTLLDDTKEIEKKYDEIRASYYEIKQENTLLKEKILSLEEIHKFSKVETLKYSYKEAEDMLNCGWKVKHVVIRSNSSPLFVLSPPENID